MNSSSKQCALLFPQTVVCSGHGECDTTKGECVCDVGWSSFGDFAIVDGADCDVDVMVVRALWGVGIGFTLLTLFLGLRYFHHKFVFHSAFKGKTMFELVEDPMVMFPFWFLLNAIMIIILFSLRIAFTEERVIGGDFGVSFLWAMHWISIMCGGAELVKAFSKFLMSSAKLMPESVRTRMRLEGKIIDRSMPFLYIAIMVVSIMVLPIIWYPNSLLVFAGIHFIGIGGLVLIIGYLVCMKAFAPVIVELQKHLKAASVTDSGIPREHIDQIKEILFKMKVAFSILAPFVVCASGIFVIFGSWPFMLRKVSYVYPVVQVASSNCIAAIMLSVTNFASSSSSDSKRGEVVPNDNGKEVSRPTSTKLFSAAVVATGSVLPDLP